MPPRCCVSTAVLTHIAALRLGCLSVRGAGVAPLWDLLTHPRVVQVMPSETPQTMSHGAASDFGFMGPPPDVCDIVSGGTGDVSAFASHAAVPNSVL